VVHGDLVAARALVYDPAGLVCSRPAAEAESAEYGAYAFTVDGRSVRFRVAKTTSTKVGGFVTVWQRSEAGPIRPFDAADGVDLFVISTRDGGRLGQFVFSAEVLRERDIVSTDGVGGKRGFRVYPPWVVTTGRQARSTQVWQVERFLPLTLEEGERDGERARVDVDRARALYHP
jgi:hypothetical protein